MTSPLSQQNYKLVLNQSVIKLYSTRNGFAKCFIITWHEMFKQKNRKRHYRIKHIYIYLSSGKSDKTSKALE